MDSDWLTPALTTFGVIFLAELGDKSQLVCMTLAARHPQRPVLIGASIAFMVLNTLAVVFGVGLAAWIPERVLAGGVALLFAIFGVLALRSTEAETDAALVQERSGRSVMLTTFLLILLAEMGDKTQLAVAGLASSQPPLAVWIGASVALVVTSALGVMAGYRLVKVMPLQRLHQASGIIFLLLAGLALTKAI